MGDVVTPADILARTAKLLLDQAVKLDRENAELRRQRLDLETRLRDALDEVGDLRTKLSQAEAMRDELQTLQTKVTKREAIR